MKYLVLIIGLFMAGISQAQDARVIELSPEDSAQAAASYKALQDAQKNYDKLRAEITKKYLTVPGDSKDATWERYYGNAPAGVFLTPGTGTSPLLPYSSGGEIAQSDGSAKKNPKLRYWREGWYEKDFDFDTGFHFLVPKKPVQTATPYWNNGCSVFTTAPVAN